MPARKECNFYWDVYREIRERLSGDEIIRVAGRARRDLLKIARGIVESHEQKFTRVKHRRVWRARFTTCPGILCARNFSAFSDIRALCASRRCMTLIQLIQFNVFMLIRPLNSRFPEDEQWKAFSLGFRFKVPSKRNAASQPLIGQTYFHSDVYFASSSSFADLT